MPISCRSRADLARALTTRAYHLLPGTSSYLVPPPTYTGDHGEAALSGRLYDGVAQGALNVLLGPRILQDESRVLTRTRTRTRTLFLILTLTLTALTLTLTLTLTLSLTLFLTLFLTPTLTPPRTQAEP